MYAHMYAHVARAVPGVTNDIGKHSVVTALLTHRYLYNTTHSLTTISLQLAVTFRVPLQLCKSVFIMSSVYVKSCLCHKFTVCVINSLSGYVYSRIMLRDAVQYYCVAVWREPASGAGRTKSCHQLPAGTRVWLEILARWLLPVREEELNSLWRARRVREKFPAVLVRV